MTKNERLWKNATVFQIGRFYRGQFVGLWNERTGQWVTDYVDASDYSENSGRDVVYALHEQVKTRGYSVRMLPKS